MLTRFRRYFWARVATAATPSTKLSELATDQWRRANEKYQEKRIRKWLLCPEFGGSNLALTVNRQDALNYVAKIGPVRYVDDERGVIVYTPKTQ